MVTRVVNTHDAKSRLSELIREAEEGVDVIVARNGHPVARIVAWKPERPTRVRGSDAAVSSDEEIVAMFDESSQRAGP